MLCHMAHAVKKKKKGLLFSLLLIFSLVAGCIVILILTKDDLWEIASNPERIKTWIEDFGIWGPIAFIGLQIIQVVIFIIPGEIPQIAGGMLFGIWGGLLYSTVGIAIGSTVNFYLARVLKQSFVERFFSKENLKKMQKLISSSKSVVIYFFLFLIPGIPKDVIAYIAGLSHIRFRVFIVISSVGRLPGLILSVCAGEALVAKNLLVALILLGIGAALLFLGFYFRVPIIRFIETKCFIRECEDDAENPSEELKEKKTDAKKAERT